MPAKFQLNWESGSSLAKQGWRRASRGCKYGGVPWAWRLMGCPAFTSPVWLLPAAQSLEPMAVISLPLLVRAVVFCMTREG